MATRYRWYFVDFGMRSIDQVVTLLASHSLSENSDSGFVLVERSNSVSSFRFFSRTVVFVTNIDNDGNTDFSQVQTLGVSTFSLVSIDGTTLLRSENPGRNLRDLFNTMGKIFGLGFTAVPVTFEKYAPKSFLKYFVNHKLINLKVRGAVPGLLLYTVMEFDSKDGIIVEQLPLPKNFEFQVVQAVYEVKHKLVKGKIGYFANGTVRVAGGLGLRLIELVESELSRLERRANIFRI